MTEKPFAAGDTVKQKSALGPVMKVIATSDDGKITCRYGPPENEQVVTFDAAKLVHSKPLPTLDLVYARRADTDQN